jgi:linoleoyl-CoA desaturase
MKAKVVKFNTTDQSQFFKELRKNVNSYFKENNISKYGNFHMIIKTIFMVSLYFVPLILLLTGVVSSFWPAMLMWVLMGFGMSGVGFSVMHDANHGSYSKNQKVNDALGFLITFIGGYKENWKIQHNILHHSYTNVEGFDEDIKNPTMRLSPDQERKWFHRFQAFYAPFLYGIMTLYWFSVKDYQGLVRYNKRNLLSHQKITFNSALIKLTLYKILYAVVMIVLPFVLIELPWWQILMGMLVMHFICGLALGLIFQPAHVIEETSFYAPNETGNVDNNWAIHQMKTTANFAHNNRLLSWFIGGLNYQVEHHLFPNICHIHYRKISVIVKETAAKYNVPYLQHKTFYGAVKSHFVVLYQLGKGTYQHKLAPV